MSDPSNHREAVVTIFNKILRFKIWIAKDQEYRQTT